MDHVTRHSKAPHSKMFTCLSSGLKLDQTNLLKFVISPDDSLILDLKDELPGKSFWITSSRKILEASCRENLFSQALSKKIHIPENFLLQVETSLVKQFNATIGFCRRSGLLVWGFEKVRATLLKEKAFLRIEALDGSDGEKLKLDSITIVPVLQSMDFVKGPETKKWGTKNGELNVSNPPTFEAVTLGELAGDAEEG